MSQNKFEAGAERKRRPLRGDRWAKAIVAICFFRAAGMANLSALHRATYGDV
jgi:hypothetical protein